MESKRRRLERVRRYKTAAKSLAKMTRNLAMVYSSDSDDTVTSEAAELPQQSLNSEFESTEDNEPCNVNSANPEDNEPCDVSVTVDLNDSDVDPWNWETIDNDNDFVPTSDSEDEDQFIDTDCLKKDLAAWTNQYQIKHNAVDDLLKLLQKHGIDDLPVTARTLLKTEKNVETSIVSGMQYIHFNFKDRLLKYIEQYPVESLSQLQVIEFSLNIDGVPVFKSTQSTFWPILCALHIPNEPTSVFPITLTYGSSKPADLDFLSDAVKDIREVLDEGLECCGRVIPVRLRCIVCDAPARALVKNTKLYSGYYGCERCTQRGEWLKKVSFQEVEFTLRTDESFRSQSQEAHHKGYSPFCDLPIDMITSFSIDYMHQVCIGVMKRLLLMWLRGHKENRISAAHIAEINAKLVQLRPYIPSDFARKPRGLEEIDRWKATEFRQILLYTGKLVLHRVLRKELFEHFMCLSIAINIFVCPSLTADPDHRRFADELLRCFVVQGRDLYGPKFIVYNVHTLLHTVCDVETHGNLDMCSAFPFESYLHQLKKLVRSGRNPIVQVVKRLGEMDQNQSAMHTKKSKVFTNKPNNAYILSDDSCCEVTAHAASENSELQYLCRVYERTEPLFRVPCDSRIVGVHVANSRRTRMKVLHQSLLNRKAIMILEPGTRVIFMAILHQV